MGASCFVIFDLTSYYVVYYIRKTINFKEKSILITLDNFHLLEYFAIIFTANMVKRYLLFILFVYVVLLKFSY